MKYWKLAFAFALAVLVVSCLGNKRNKKTTIPVGTYRLIALIEHEDTLNTKSRTTRFEVKEGRMNTNVGCNQIGGVWEQIGFRVSIREMMSTEMYCEDSSRLEERYLALLSQVDGLSMPRGQLVLKIRKKPVLVFMRIPEKGKY